MAKITQQIRQGDVLITPVPKIPDGAIPIKLGDSLVLAGGEATGHSHSIIKPKNKLLAFKHGQELYLQVKSPVDLEHQEHRTATIDPGAYVVRRQTEVWLDEVRQVRD